MLILANVWGWMVGHRRLMMYAGLVALLVVAVLCIRYCGRSGPKPIDEKKLQEAVKAIEEKNDAKLKEILVEADVKEKQIDANVANGRVKTLEAANDAREKYANMNTSELAAELEKRK